MAEGKLQRSAPAKKTAARGHPAGSRARVAADATELSEEVLQSVEDGQRAAIDAVQRFVDRVDRVLPALPHGEEASRRQEVIDSALEMADRLVHTQYEFLRNVVDSAGKALGGSGKAR